MLTVGILAGCAGAKQRAPRNWQSLDWPVLSRIDDLLSRPKQHLPNSQWHKFIPRPGAYVYTVKFAGVPETSELSQAEVALIDEIYTRHRDKTEWELTDYTHTLPEWSDPKGSSTPIPFEKILRAAGISAARFRGIAEAAEADWQMDQLLASVQ